MRKLHAIICCLSYDKNKQCEFAVYSCNFLVPTVFFKSRSYLTNAESISAVVHVHSLEDSGHSSSVVHQIALLPTCRGRNMEAIVLNQTTETTTEITEGNTIGEA